MRLGCNCRELVWHSALSILMLKLFWLIHFDGYRKGGGWKDSLYLMSVHSPKIRERTRSIFGAPGVTMRAVFSPGKRGRYATKGKKRLHVTPTSKLRITSLSLVRDFKVARSGFSGQ